jgi:hypothetical protein
VVECGQISEVNLSFVMDAFMKKVSQFVGVFFGRGGSIPLTTNTAFPR